MSYSQVRPRSTLRWLPFSYPTPRGAGKLTGDGKPFSAISFLLGSFPSLLTPCTPCLISLGQPSLQDYKIREKPRPCERQGEQALAQVPKGLQKPTPRSDVQKRSLESALRDPGNQTQPQQKLDLKERNERRNSKEHTRQPAKRIHS